jgi:hypothetical protein
MAWYLDRGVVPDLAVVRDSYLTNRVQIQIEYFARNLRLVEPRFRRLRRLATFFTFAAIVTGLIALAMSIANRGAEGNPFLELSTLLLPLGSAAILSLLVAQDYVRRSTRYREMRVELEQAAGRLSVARTWSGFTRIAMETERLLLQEVLEWHSISRFTREPH